MPELDAVMLAHVLFPSIDPEFPASLSRRMITDFLRGQLGFDRHLVLTDDLDMGAISHRYPDHTDVTAALMAGNDLAMICHHTERAEEAAARLASLPPSVAIDAENRLQRFRKKLHAPLKWSRGAWDKICADIAELSAQVPAADGSAGDSPVVNY